MHRHLVALRATYEIRIGGEKAAEVHKKLFTPFRDTYAVQLSPGVDPLLIICGVLALDLALAPDEKARDGAASPSGT